MESSGRPFTEWDDLRISYTAEANFKAGSRFILEGLKQWAGNKEEKIIRMRYGQFDGKEYTLEEIGKIMGITRERVRQIENKALDKLRTKAGASEKLKPFYVK